MSDRKNVLVIVFDSLRKDRISVYNDEVDFTPNFEELANESRIYTSANAQASWTLPSTASMFTGEYPWEHGATHGNEYLDSDRELLAEVFQQKDYNTKLVTPNAWLSPPMGTAKGFDEVENFLGLASREPFETIFEKVSRVFNSLPESLRQKFLYSMSVVEANFTDFVNSTDSCKTIEETCSFLENVDEKEDFFLFVNTLSPHEPYDTGNPPQEYLDKHGVENMEKLPSTEREFFTMDWDREVMEKAYDASVEYSDDLLGRITDALEDNNLEDDTVLVVLSDHGQAMGKDGLFGHQFTLMDRVIETPLMVSGPGIEPSEEEEVFELRQLYNLLPKLAGVKKPGEVEKGIAKGGYEYPVSYKGVVPEERREEFNRKIRYVKDGERKIVKEITEDGEELYTMYDLEAGEEVEVEEDMKRKIDNIQETGKGGERDIEDEEVKKRLEDLGYV